MRANPFKSGSAFVVRGPRSAGGRKLTLDDELYTRQEAQEALGIGSKALSQLVASQEIPHVNFGGSFFFPVEDIDALPKVKSVYEEPSWVEIPPVAKIAKLKESGMSLPKIAAELMVSPLVIRKYLEGLGDTPLLLARRKRLPSHSWDSIGVLASRAEPESIEDLLTTIYYMHLNKFTVADIGLTVDVDESDIADHVAACDRKYKNVRYVRALERDMGSLIHGAVYGQGAFRRAAQEYGVSLHELAKFVVAHKNLWARYAHVSNPRIRRNPFTIRDSFKIIASASGRKRISTNDEELLRVEEVPGFVQVSEDDLRLLIELEQMPHIMFGDEPFVPFEELDALEAQGPSGGLSRLVSQARRTRPLRINPGVATWVIVFGGVLLFWAIRNGRFR
jgi:hypothetical protein